MSNSTDHSAEVVKEGDFSYLTKDRVYALEKVFDQYERDIAAVTDKTKNFLGVILPFSTVAFASGSLLLAREGGLSELVLSILTFTISCLIYSVLRAIMSYTMHVTKSVDDPNELVKCVLDKTIQEGEIYGRYAKGLALSSDSMKAIATSRGEHTNAALRAFFTALVLFITAIAVGLVQIQERNTKDIEHQEIIKEKTGMRETPINSTSGSGTTTGSTTIDSRDTATGATTTKGGTGGTTK